MTQNTLKIIASPVVIASLSHDGRGVATVNGKTTFIAGALPGEKVTYQILKKHSRYDDAETVEILEASVERVEPGCPHFSICGGCSMQHLSTDGQLGYKQATLLEQLLHFGNVTPEEVSPPISGHVWHYRRKARLGVRYVHKKEKLLVGFREKSSRYLADLSTCPILHESVGKKLAKLAAVIRSLSQYEHIPQVEVAVSDTKTALIFRHMTDLTDEDLQKLTAFGETNHFEIYLQPNSPKPLSKLFPADGNTLLSYSLNEYGLELQFHPLDFTQVNGEINPLMVHKALTLLNLKKEDTVLDLFCGLGNFTLPLAKFVAKVTGVEGSEEMVTRGSQNAAFNNIQNTEFFAANLANIESITDKWIKNKYTKILLDPPRTGAKEIIEEKFKHFKAEKIVYVSCNPATLARDAGILVNDLGYKLKSVGIINMFPHTSHVEAIALFEK